MALSEAFILVLSIHAEALSMYSKIYKGLNVFSVFSVLMDPEIMPIYGIYINL